LNELFDAIDDNDNNIRQTQPTANLEEFFSADEQLDKKQDWNEKISEVMYANIDSKTKHAYRLILCQFVVYLFTDPKVTVSHALHDVLFKDLLDIDDDFCDNYIQALCNEAMNHLNIANKDYLLINLHNITPDILGDFCCLHHWCLNISTRKHMDFIALLSHISIHNVR